MEKSFRTSLPLFNTLWPPVGSGSILEPFWLTFDSEFDLISQIWNQFELFYQILDCRHCFNNENTKKSVVTVIAYPSRLRVHALNLEKTNDILRENCCKSLIRYPNNWKCSNQIDLSTIPETLSTFNEVNSGNQANWNQLISTNLKMTSKRYIIQYFWVWIAWIR